MGERVLAGGKNILLVKTLKISLRIPTGKAGEEDDSRNYRNISLDRWITLYRSKICFLPAFFLTPRMTPAAPHCAAGSSFLKAVISRCQANQNNAGGSGDDRNPEPMYWEE